MAFEDFICGDDNLNINIRKMQYKLKSGKYLL